MVLMKKIAHAHSILYLYPMLILCDFRVSITIKLYFLL